MKLPLAALACAVVHAWAAAQSPIASRVQVKVPATSNPYLAGMPKGARADIGDRAPNESPVEVEIPAGAREVTFTASGAVNHEPGCPPRCDSPDGGELLTEHRQGAENGIAAVTAPYNALIGVFLSDDRPDKSRPPKDLSFEAKRRQFIALSPLLKQIFFIGRGVTAKGEIRRFAIPQGATRLFLGIMDGFDWRNNTGAFSVSVKFDQTAVDSSMYNVDSSVSFANWPCMPERSRCTPAKEMVEERAPGQFHVLLPAQMEWGVSVPIPAGAKFTVRDFKGTVCLTSAAESCAGPKGLLSRDSAQGPPAGEGFPAPQEPAGALIFKTAGGRVYFSVNDRSGAAFQAHDGFFEFDVLLY